MKWGSFFKKLVRGVATAMTLGLIGRGNKTKAAGTLINNTLDEVEKEEK